MSMILHLNSGKIQNTYYEMLFEINGPHILGPGRADIMCQIWAKMGRWALMGRQKTGQGWAKMGQAAAQSTANTDKKLFKINTFAKSLFTLIGYIVENIFCNIHNYLS